MNKLDTSQKKVFYTVYTHSAFLPFKIHVPSEPERRVMAGCGLVVPHNGPPAGQGAVYPGQQSVGATRSLRLVTSAIGFGAILESLKPGVDWTMFSNLGT